MINPYEVSKPEGYCTGCAGFTTNYDSRGECREHGIEVTENNIEAEQEKLRMLAAEWRMLRSERTARNRKSR